MTIRIGVISHCLACGNDISPMMFPHLCNRCIESIQLSGGLPNDVMQQIRLKVEELDE